MWTKHLLNGQQPCKNGVKSLDMSFVKTIGRFVIASDCRPWKVKQHWYKTARGTEHRPTSKPLAWKATMKPPAQARPLLKITQITFDTEPKKENLLSKDCELGSQAKPWNPRLFLNIFYMFFFLFLCFFYDCDLWFFFMIWDLGMICVRFWNDLCMFFFFFNSFF